jgi:hypothetical protein
MKVIPLSEAKARLSYYSRICHQETIIVTVKGVLGATCCRTIARTCGA